MKAANILETIGNTPHIRINRLFGDKAEVWIKSERSNPAASIKDRIALSMVEDAGSVGQAQARRRRSSSRPAATPASASPWSPRSRAIG